jgi:hypothetical protein
MFLSFAIIIIILVNLSRFGHDRYDSQTLVLTVLVGLVSGSFLQKNSYFRGLIIIWVISFINEPLRHTRALLKQTQIKRIDSQP